MEISCGEKPPKSPSLYANSMTPYELTSPLSSPPSVPPQNTLVAPPNNNSCSAIQSNQHSSNLSSTSAFYPPPGAAPTAVDYNLHVTSLTVNYPAAFAATADGASTNSLYMPGMNHMTTNPLVAYQNYPYYPNPTCGATPTEINQHHHLLPSATSLSPYNPYYSQMPTGGASVSYGSSGNALSNNSLQSYNCAAPMGHQSEWHLGFLPNPLENRILTSSRLDSDVELKSNPTDNSQHFRIAASRNVATSSLSNKLLIPVTSNPNFDSKASDTNSCHEPGSLSTPGSKVFAWMSKRPSKCTNLNIGKSALII